jgi:hypothetical protein
VSTNLEALFIYLLGSSPRHTVTYRIFGIIYVETCTPHLVGISPEFFWTSVARAPNFTSLLCSMIHPSVRLPDSATIY